MGRVEARGRKKRGAPRELGWQLNSFGSVASSWELLPEVEPVAGGNVVLLHRENAADLEGRS